MCDTIMQAASDGDLWHAECKSKIAQHNINALASDIDINGLMLFLVYYGLGKYREHIVTVVWYEDYNKRQLIALKASVYD